MKPGEMSDDEKVAMEYLREYFPETFMELVVLKLKKMYWYWKI